MESQNLKAEKLELWQTLCAQAAVEQDSRKLMELVKEIERLMSVRPGRWPGQSGKELVLAKDSSAS
jgi:hypothetical protein